MNALLKQELLNTIQKSGFLAKEYDWLEAFHARVSTADTPLNYFDLLDAALKKPQLFCQKPEKLNGNAERSAALLGLTKAQFVAAALKKPLLFCQKPERLNGNAERSATLLGLTKRSSSPPR
jgi:hypothetical protein